ncbi:MAG: pyridoxamine 5'-phosphate oxidase family protein [Proteobacteria bacterium]|nr:pyridoxamine 5'-phosphate oxidase family protein [Pseudomonadota bacterium]
MSLAMSVAERQAFLADVHVGVIAIDRAGQAPLAVPIWYAYDPEIGVWVITGEKSQKGIALAAAGRFTLCAQTEQPPVYRYVSVEGPVASVRPADREKDTRPMAHRYFGPELGDRYVESTPDGGGQVFTMRPERWRTVDYSKLGG